MEEQRSPFMLHMSGTDAQNTAGPPHLTSFKSRWNTFLFAVFNEIISYAALLLLLFVFYTMLYFVLFYFSLFLFSILFAPKLQFLIVFKCMFYSRFYLDFVFWCFM